MFRLAVLLLLALVVAVGAAACGGEEEASPTAETVETGTDTGTETESGETETGADGAEGDPANGKEIFAAQACGSCHTLSDAGTSGTIGPNLDDSQPDFELVVERVTNGSGAMPSFSDKLSEDEINDVAAYVSETAGS
jgi:mono/diheme cytochrome c family protein